MAEADSYLLIKQKLEGLLATKGREFYLEVTATKGPSERLKKKIPTHREIVFSFLKKRPDLFGFMDTKYSSDLITVEVKERIEKLEDIYQAKLYKEVLDARYGFLITAKPIPEEMKRLCKITPSVLRSASDSIYGFLAIGQFDKEKGQFVDWFEDNPFEHESYWK